MWVDITSSIVKWYSFVSLTSWTESINPHMCLVTLIPCSLWHEHSCDIYCNRIFLQLPIRSWGSPPNVVGLFGWHEWTQPGSVIHIHDLTLSRWQVLWALDGSIIYQNCGGHSPSVIRSREFALWISPSRSGRQLSTPLKRLCWSLPQLVPGGSFK